MDVRRHVRWQLESGLSSNAGQGGGAKVGASLERPISTKSAADEDQRVLDATREPAPSRREFAPEAHERLIGHPRVHNGARGNARVEVVRGSCRIEAEEEAGYIRVVVEPASAKLGVNVVPEGEERLIVYRVNDAMQRVIDVLPSGLRVPIAQKAAVLRVLGELSQSGECSPSWAPNAGASRRDACLRLRARRGPMVQAGGVLR